jgi:hypothetical protein
VAELDGLGPEEIEEPGPEEPPAEVDVAGRPQAHDQYNLQSGPCCSGAASAVRSVVGEEVRNQNHHPHTYVMALHKSVVPVLHCLLVPSWTQRGRRRTG